MYTRLLSRERLAQGSFLLLVAGVVVLALLALLHEEAPAPAAPRATTYVPPPPRAPGIVLEVPTAPPPPARAARDEAAERRAAAEAAAAARAKAKAGSSPSRKAADEPDRRIRIHLKIVGRGPVVGALVSAKNNTRRLKPRRTTGEGDVLLDLVSPDEGRLLVTVRHARYGRQTFTIEPITETQTLKLARGRPGPLTGTILATDGTVPHGPVIVVTDHEGISTEFREKDLDSWDGALGRYRLDLAPDTYQARANAPGFCASDWQTVTVVDLMEATASFVVLRAGKISGYVKLPPDLERKGTVAVDLEVEWTAPGSSVSTVEGRRAKLGNSGEYALDGIRPGWFRVRASDAEHDGIWATVQLREGEQIQGFTLIMDRQRTQPAIHGTVQDTAGEPVEGATVWAQGSRTSTDDLGNFILRIERGAEQVEVTKDGFDPAKHAIESPPPGETDPPGFVILLDQPD